MKKSCSEKELKLVTTSNVGVLNDSDVKRRLTEDQNEIDRKLLESKISDEGLSWLEKNNFLKTINISLSRVDSEIKQNTRLAKVNSSGAAKWIDNSFETPENKKGIISSNKSYEKDTDQSNCLQNNNHSVNNKKELLSNSSESSTGENIQETSKKPAKKVHFMKIQVEEISKKECNILADSGKGKDTICGKKRTSPLNKGSDLTKKPKMEHSNNDEIKLQESDILKIELDLQRRRKNIPFKNRDIKTLLAECEFRNKKWKETFSKYDTPTHWGIPIVKNCAHKWDGKQIPQKLLLRYQKYLLSKNLFHPLYLPVNFQNSGDVNATQSETLSQSSSISSETQSEKMEMNFSQEVIAKEDENETKISDIDNYNPSTSYENGCRMVLRNRNQTKSVLVDDDEFSSGPDDSEDWPNKQKSGKKLKNNCKIKKAGNLNGQQLISELEKFSINKNLETTHDENFESLMMDDSKNQLNVKNTKTLPDPDTMVCPVCSLRFKKQLIEGHATECASKTYKD